MDKFTPETRKKAAPPHWLFALLFAVSFLIGLPFAMKGIFFPETVGTEAEVNDDESEPDTPPTTAPTTVPTTVPTTAPTGTTKKPKKTTTAPTTTTTTLPPKPSFTEVDETYFDDALFIGDSRAEGLRLFSGIKNADFFTNTGMSVYNIAKKELSVASVGGKTTLDNLLSTQTYGKVYVILGINELGYNFKKSVSKYGELIASIRGAQPGATVYVCANLHVAAARSDRDEVHNNANIDRFNEAIGELADGMEIFYIDVNEIFDDENGALRPELTNDNTHIYAKHYKEWANWLMTKGIVR